jgi:hypothetical protein
LLEAKGIPPVIEGSAIEGFPMKKALQLFVVLSFALLLLSAGGSQTIYGYISCSACGAKGAADSHAECMEKCLAKGAEIVLVADDTKKIIRIDNPDAVSGHHAQHVALYGYFKDSGFYIISVRMI